MRTTVEAVRLLLSGSGISPEDEQITQAIEDAALIVSEYELGFSGVTTDVAPEKLIDQQADFLEVRVGARVRNIRANVDAVVEAVVSKTELALDQDIFLGREPYFVEDVARVELAERYKAASLLMRAASQATGGIESASLGPMRISFGAPIRTYAQRQFANEFEERYQTIVGPIALV